MNGSSCAAGCPGRTTLLVAIRRRGTPHGTPGHNVVHDYAFLAVCAACGTGRLESFSHDCWHHPDDEPWDMSWVRTVPAADVDLLRGVLRTCPAPENDQCECPVHTALADSSQRLGPSATTAAVTLVDGVARFERNG